MNPVFAICREDRAFLCRSCDLSIHSANEHVAKHERFLMSGVTVEVQAMTSISGTAEFAAPEVTAVAEQAQEVPAVVPQAAAEPKKMKGTKRKAAQTQEDSFNSADAAVPTFAGSLEAPSFPAPLDAEFNSFVQDFLGPSAKDSKSGDVSMANFLDNFFDDIPEDDFGVVPDMGFVQ